MRIRLALIIALLGTVLGAGEIHTWTSKDGETTYTGEFWRVEKGILEIRPTGAQDILPLKLSQLSPEDIVYLVRKKMAVRPSFQAARASLVLGPEGQPVRRGKGFVRVAGSVQAIITDNLIIVEGPEKSYAVATPAEDLVEGADFEAYCRPVGKGSFETPSGVKVWMYRSAVALTQEQFKAMIRENPFPFLKVISGTSKAYREWAAAQRKVQNLQAREEHRQTVAEAKADIKEERRKERKGARREKSIRKKLDSFRKELRGLETKKKRLEAEKKQLKRSTRRYTELVYRIHQLGNEIRHAKKAIAELEAKLED